MFGLDFLKRMKGMDLDAMSELLSTAIGGDVEVTSASLPNGGASLKIDGRAKDGRIIRGVITLGPADGSPVGNLDRKAASAIA